MGTAPGAAYDPVMRRPAQSNRWPAGTDVAVAVAFAVVAQVELRVSSQNIFKGTAPLAADSILVLVPTAALCWRRAAPFAASVGLAAGMTLTGAAFHGTICFFGGLLPFLITLYSASAWARHPFDRLAALVPVALVLPMPAYVPAFNFPGDLVFAAVACAGAWTVGQLVRRWRRQSEALADALEAAERNRDARAKLAVAEERTRIARELHDVVAHGMSVMVMQAGLARLDLRERPDAAEESLSVLERTGRQSLHEMRRLLGVLRSVGTIELEPQPRMAELPSLIDGFRRAGLHVETTVTGAAAVLAETQDLSAFRIIQEALTNALKHGARGWASLAVTYLPDRVGITVTNPVAPGARRPVDGGGHGLVGIGERAAMFGGTSHTQVRDRQPRHRGRPAH